MLERKTGTRSQRALEAYENLKNPEKFQHEVPTKNPSRLSNRGKAIGGILVLIVSTGITVPVVIITSSNGNTTTTTPTTTKDISGEPTLDSTEPGDVALLQSH